MEGRSFDFVFGFFKNNWESHFESHQETEDCAVRPLSLVLFSLDLLPRGLIDRVPDLLPGERASLQLALAGLPPTAQVLNAASISMAAGLPRTPCRYRTCQRLSRPDRVVSPDKLKDGYY